MTRRLRAALAAATLTAALAPAPSAQALDINAFNVGLTDPGTVFAPTPGAPQLVGGAHPDVTVDLRYPPKPGSADLPLESVRSADVKLPRGLIFDPTAVPRCTSQQLSELFAATCPLSSQIGTLEIDGFQPFPIYNMEPPPGVPAQFGANVLKTTVKINGEVRTGGDYGLSAKVVDISQGLPLKTNRLEFWGVPADPVHDAERRTATDNGGQITGSANIPARPLTSNPGRCTGTPLLFTAAATSWQNPTPGITRSAYTQETDGQPLTITGCDTLPFEPTVSATPTTSAPDSATGLDVDVAVPQSDSPSGRSSAHLKDLSLLLPEGMNVNPAAAGGLTACSPAQIALSSPGSPSCPDASSIGSVTVDTPLLENPLTGRAYLAKQGDNPFGTTLALYLVAEGDGVVIKLAGRIDPDPATGRLRVTFSDNPELPFSRLRVSLDGGERAPLTTPASCGSKTVEGTATPWSGGPVKPVGNSFSIACPAGLGAFAPGFTAGTRSPTAGLFSPLSIGLTRPDGQATLRDLTFELPTGLLAKLRGVPPCGAAAASAGTCGAASRIASATLTTGAGQRPFPVAGDVYLTGPYKGAPFGLVTRVRAVAGPLDLGTVVVRQALFLDPTDLRARIVSDPLPTILSGIPIRLRTLDVNVDRPGFTVNPTSCAAKAVRGRLGAADGRQAAVSVRFRVGGCQALELKPKLALRLSGSGSALRDGGHPALKAILTQGSKQSNLKRAEVTLPSSLALDPDNAQTLCEFAEGQKAEPKCPKGSIVGRAKARSPLLGQTLSGPVYFVKGQRTDPQTGRVIRTLPTLVVPLQGGGVKLTLRARTAVSGSKLVTTFDPIPDASVSRFDFALTGGKNGILVANSSVCSKSRTLGIGIRGQNNALAKSSPTLAADCK